MASQKGLHQFMNKIGTSTGYKKKGVISNAAFEKLKGGPTQAQFASLPSMAVNRLNAQEFAPCNWYSKNKLNLFSGVMTQKNGSLRIELMKLMMKQIKLGTGAPGERTLDFNNLSWMPNLIKIGTKSLSSVFGGPLSISALLPDFMMDVTINPFDIAGNLKQPRFSTHFRFIAYLTEFEMMQWDAGLSAYTFPAGYSDNGMTSFAGNWFDFGSGTYTGELLSPPQLNFLGALVGCTCLILEIQFAQFNGISPCLMTGDSYASVIALQSY
jgi:hypothetical protein